MARHGIAGLASFTLAGICVPSRFTHELDIAQGGIVGAAVCKE